jgi:predicted RNase H-like nuclease (RuvC/YqgF family)
LILSEFPLKQRRHTTNQRQRTIASVESRIDDAERKMQELERRLTETTQLGFLVSGRLRGREYIRAAQVRPAGLALYQSRRLGYED